LYQTWRTYFLKQGRNFRKVTTSKIVLGLSSGENNFCSSETKSDRETVSRTRFCFGDKNIGTKTRIVKTVLVSFPGENVGFSHNNFFL